MTTKAKHDIHGKPYNRTAMITLLLIATFAGVLNQTSLGIKIFSKNIWLPMKI